MTRKVEVTVPEPGQLLHLLKHPIAVAAMSPLLVWGIVQIYDWNTHDSEIKPKVETLQRSYESLSEGRQQAIIDAKDEKLIELRAAIGSGEPTEAQRPLLLLYRQQKERAERELDELDFTEK